MSTVPPNLLEGLSQLAQAHGKPISVVALRSQVTFGPDGSPNMNSLRATLGAAGLLMSRYDGSLTSLGTDRLPALAACRDGSFVVVNNPAELGAELPNGYAGYCIVLVPRPAPDLRSELPARRNARAWFWKVLWSLRPFYMHVAIATLVVNILSIAVSLYVMNVYDRVVPNRTYDTLWVLTIGTGAALCFDFVARMLRGWLIDTAGKRADIEISSGLFQRMLSMQFIQKPVSSGSFVNNLRDFESIRDVLTSATLTALIDMPFFLLFVAVIAMIAPPLAAVPLGAAVIVLAAGLIVQRPLARHIQDMMRESSQRQGMAVETVEGLETLKVNNALGHMQQRWEWYTGTVAVSSMKARNLSNFVINTTSVVQQMCTVGTVVIGVYLIHSGQLSMGGLIGAVILCGRSIAPLAQVAGLAVRVQQARAAFSGLQAMMDKELEREPDRTYLSLPQPKGAIQMSNLDFSHSEDGPTLFKDLHLQIRAGESVAILGRTGSGKSTLLRLAAGLYQPNSGLVTFDGIDMRQIDPAEIRSAIGLVPQESRLFLGTLRENLEMARTDQKTGDQELVRALQSFGLDQMIANHPRGLDMQLGEDGMGLSGGQKRLVTLARLALRNPVVALLDEPTSGLDPNTERSVLDSLKRWSQQPVDDGQQKRTMIIVTHRPQVLEIVDRVIVVEAGRILVDGPRQAVMQQLAKGITVSRNTGGPAIAQPAAQPGPQPGPQAGGQPTQPTQPAQPTVTNITTRRAAAGGQQRPAPAAGTPDSES